MECSTKEAESVQKKEIKGRTKGEETPVSVTINLEEDRRQEREAGGLEIEGTKWGAQRFTSSQ